MEEENMPRDKSVHKTDNLEINKSKNYVIISVNPRIYSMSMIFSAAYVFIDKAYVIVDGDPNEKILVQLKAKDGEADLKKLGREFNTELVNYAFYHVEYLKNNPVREAIIQRAFLTQASQPAEQSPEEKIEPFEDTEGIAIPWESKKKKGRKIEKSKSRKRNSKSRSKS